MPAQARRVLFLARHLNSGGIPIHMMTLARGLLAEGWEVALATRGQDGVHPHGPAWFEEHGIPHFSVPFPGPPLAMSTLTTGARSLFALDAVVRKYRPDLMHAHYRATTTFAAAVSVRRRIPFVTTLHLQDIPASSGHRLGSFWGRCALAISAETRADLQRRFGLPLARIRTVYNGCDETHFRPPTDEEHRNARAVLDLPPTAAVVTLIGRLVPTKGHDVLIRTLARLRAAGRDVVGLCPGEGNLAGDLCRQAEEAGVADLLRLPGYLDSRTALWAADLAVLPSAQEGFPLVIVEAMLCGVVPIRTPAGGARDQIDNCVNGFLVPFGDDGALADRIGQLLDDPDLRARMSAAAHTTALRRFTIRRMALETISAYESARGGQASA